MSFSQIQASQAHLNEDAGAGYFRNSILGAVPSPDGLYVAAIASPSEIQIWECPSRHRPMMSHTAAVSSKQTQKVLAHAFVLQWSPEVVRSIDGATDDALSAASERNLLRTWLLVSDGQRLVFLSIRLSLHGDSETECDVIIDLDLGSHFGTISFAYFVFSHEYAIVLQGVSIQASIISLTRPERHDIANIKYADNQGLAISLNYKYFAILARVEGQDLVLVFTTTEMESVKSTTFSPLTLDAEGIKWCPNADPLLCVWDAASCGLKVLFFTANGHNMRQLDLVSSHPGVLSSGTELEGLGVNTVNWLARDGNTVLAVFYSSGRLILRHHSGAQKLYPSLAVIDHHSVVDGTAYQVWQESSEGKHLFSQHLSSFEPRQVKRSAGADQIAVNRDCQLLATRDSSRPWTLWIWDISALEPLAVINFRHRIKQLLWHPTDPDILLVLAFQKEPLLYIWHAAEQKMLIIERPIMTIAAETDYQCEWLNGYLEGTSLLFVRSPRLYDVGVIRLLDQDGFIFESALPKI